jgi:DNA-binding LytR/AlgR family response regulator
LYYQVYSKSFFTRILIAISSSDFLFFTQLTGIINISFADITRILLLGFLPVAILITINQERLLRSHLASAQQLNKQLLEKKREKRNLIHFESDYKNDSLIIKADLLILIRSSDNYVEVYYKNNEIVKKQMIRSSLKKIEEAITEYKFIFRCHRSFIVNINYVNEIQGNSQGYQLFFENLDFPVLVSRKYIPFFKNMIKRT